MNSYSSSIIFSSTLSEKTSHTLRGCRLSAIGLLTIGLLSVTATSVLPARAQAIVRNAQAAAAPGKAIQPATTDAYILGRSDEIGIRIYGVPDDFFGVKTFIIPVDGRLNLPWIGQVALDGLTLEEAQAKIANSYGPFIKNPQVTVYLVTPRSLRVTVAGQVQRPGSYTLTPREKGVNAGLVQVGGNPNDWPSVVTAIQAAGGLKQQADLRHVELKRLNSDGTIQETSVDLWALLQGTGSSKDVSLRDGDTILVPLSQALNPSEAQQIAAANFSPDTIAVNIAGEVKAPGAVKIKPNSSLNQAILAAGGFNDPRSNSGYANLIRLNADGSVVNRIIKVDYSNALNEETNPPLRNDDIVLISRRDLAQTSDFLGLLGTVVLGVTNPLNGLLDLFR
ncbi:MAG: polysaccharide export protein [Cyanobacteria bacterium REEB459]|nr:polysaccharide export protein [Cyanobacteria bacterium REEB459]